jgi:hypothetical protein
LVEVFRRGFSSRRMPVQSVENRSKKNEVNAAFCDYYRCPEGFARLTQTTKPSEDSGYFRLGPDTICYGRSSAGFRAACPTDELYDVEKDVIRDGSTLILPFNPSEISANLRYERYTPNSDGRKKTRRIASVLRTAYYLARPLLPVCVRRHLQRTHLRGWENISFPSWPVDASVERIFEKLLALLLRGNTFKQIPFIWFWPDGFTSCAIMTHDVETKHGRDFCTDLMDLDDTYGMKSSFQIVPEERYSVSEAFLTRIRDRGFEVNVHDLNHDGHLVRDRRLFWQRAERINGYGRTYQTAGFRSAALYRNLDWWRGLHFAYDMSVPSIGHLEAQQGGCCSVMPFFIGKMLELPLTTTQDYSLFFILNHYSIDLWKYQIAQIMERHGLASFIVHPDYITQLRARQTYKSLLTYLARLRSEGKIWTALPRDINQWWRERSQMRLIWRRNNWEIEGAGRERARVAYASLEGNSLVYRLSPESAAGPRLPNVPPGASWENSHVAVNYLP